MCVVSSADLSYHGFHTSAMGERPTERAHPSLRTAQENFGGPRKFLQEKSKFLQKKSKFLQKTSKFLQ